MSTQAPRLATNITGIDRLLDGGLPTGQITEVYGCPGAGKTAFAASLAARVIKDENHVVWLEASQPLPSSRLLDFADSEDLSQEEEGNLLQLVRTLQIPTLTSLLALLAHLASPTAEKNSIILENTRLLVLDDLTTIYNAAFPADLSRETNNRKSLVIALLASRLSRLAAQHNLVILILCKLTSKISRGGPAQLEGPFGDAWSTACSTRLLLYRDNYTRRLPPGDALALRWITAQRVKNKNILDPEAISYKISGSSVKDMNLNVDLSRSQSRLSQGSSVTLEFAVEAPDHQSDDDNEQIRQSAGKHGELEADSDEKAEGRAMGSSKRARYI